MPTRIGGSADAIYWADSNAVKLDGGKVGSFDGDEGDFFGREVVAGALFGGFPRYAD